MKANAYGLGFQHVAKQLILGENTRHFFVADIEEALTLKDYLREQFPKRYKGISIFVLHGLFDASPELFHENQLIPVINSIPELTIWLAYCVKMDNPCPYILHFDTGMSGLGLQWNEYTEKNIDLPFPPLMVMSHLNSGDELHHPQNKTQLREFHEIEKQFPHSVKSLSNSSGIFSWQAISL